MEIRLFTGVYPWDHCLWEGGREGQKWDLTKKETELDGSLAASCQPQGSSGPLMVCHSCAVLGPNGQALSLLPSHWTQVI